MSKLYPYGTFDESYILVMMQTIPDDFDEFIYQLFHTFATVDSKKTQIRLDSKICCRPELLTYWLCLCNMYGDVDTTHLMNSHVLIENEHMITWHIIDIICRVFPPCWDLSDMPIILFDQIEF